MSRQVVNIIPALMPRNFTELTAYANQLECIVDTVQIDVMDGKFVSEVSWPYQEVGVVDESFKKIVGKELEFPKIDTLNYELDLMVEAPEKGIGSWVQSGASRIIFHIESIRDGEWFWRNIAHIKKASDLDNSIKKVDIGIAIDIKTPNEEIYSHIEKIDFVQCMGIDKIGFQGQPFDDRVLHKIDDLRKRFPELIISIDGGVSLETAPMLIEAGANRLVSGSAILKSKNIEKAIEEFQGL